MREFKLKGKRLRPRGNFSKTYGDALDTLRETAVTNPIATLAAVAGVAFLLDVLWARRDCRM